jgi:hypothetical protein
VSAFQRKAREWFDAVAHAEGWVRANERHDRGLGCWRTYSSNGEGTSRGGFIVDYARLTLATRRELANPVACSSGPVCT